MDEEFENQSRDIERLSDMNFSDLAIPLPDGLDDECPFGDLDSQQFSFGAFGNERVERNTSPEIVPASSSALNDRAMDRMVSDALVHSSRSGLKLPWEDGPLSIVFGRETLQTLPVVEQCISLADHPGEKFFDTSAT